MTRTSDMCADVKPGRLTGGSAPRPPEKKNLEPDVRSCDPVVGHVTRTSDMCADVKPGRLAGGSGTFSHHPSGCKSHVLF